MSPTPVDRVESLISWGQEQGVSILEIAIGGPAAQPESVIAATSPSSRRQRRRGVGADPESWS